jgi:hypothetical protein
MFLNGLPISRQMMASMSLFQRILVILLAGVLLVGARLFWEHEVDRAASMRSHQSQPANKHESKSASATADYYDAEAKSTTVTAAEAMETCATDNNGSYTGCSKASLQSIEPTLNDADARLHVTSGSNKYQVVVTSNRDSNAATFTLSRSSNGTASRMCDTGTADIGGCSRQYGGTW